MRAKKGHKAAVGRESHEAPKDFMDFRLLTAMLLSSPQEKVAAAVNSLIKTANFLASQLALTRASCCQLSEERRV